MLLALKTLHVLGATLFLGTGLGSAWYKLRSWLSGDVRVIAWADREVVLADWIFTVPSGVIMPVTGLLLADRYGMGLDTPWIRWALAGYVTAGVFWLPAAYLQIVMRRLSTAADRDGTPLPPEWRRAQRVWAALGVPSFGATVVTIWVMVTKQPLW